ncbi:MAG: methylmalonyl Co-A mutase-associated GTPase MeaB [Bacteroidetes bacterium]|jgi:LAO/AO transport system kinase|nr:methylmalonyl Co-A mutase-associated GTPase MeaB [Bacteroidota bacterium]MBT5527830.1 methylmalonyl Co-A mutase-associated GTPase MeaB [Cytophagia bacterium]MBT3421324.1 methylmalonyl Co-A mutase-associated GTPase MeaB [Bacteroidota bacterium]MBT3933280.1 methylmalonyl Co-A mutase-associated GTPase MeaB [Bacteroidota bacterium]MBT4338769.1 methylmalonyl Co-A mutase-associated GTPase MeaB [Bacteroidota bacterium]
MAKDNKKGLSINKGVEQPSSLHLSSVKKGTYNKASDIPIETYMDGIVRGDRTILGRAITLVESALPEHQHIAQQIVEKCLPLSGNSMRLGITGIPGVGKSTFIEAFGIQLIETGRKVAVLAVDPSSDRSKGSILGDKTRMQKLAVNEHSFIRPSPSAGTLGGVARKTRESILLCEAAGYDTIFIETVGVGQSETAVHSMVDLFLLLMLPGAGDELQGIKRGIMEMADLIVINKADDNRIEKVKIAQQELLNALHLFPATESTWIPRVEYCSSLNNNRLDLVWEHILAYHTHTHENQYFFMKRKNQAKYWLYETINAELKNQFYQDNKIKSSILNYEEQVLKNEISPFVAAKQLMEKYRND